HLQRDEAVRETPLLPRKQAVATDEVTLPGMHEPVEARLERGILDRPLRADQAIGFLQANGIHGANTETPKLEVGSRLHQRVENVVLVFDTVVNLPAQFTDEVDAQEPGRSEPHRAVLRRQPWKVLTRQRRAANARQQIPRSRTRHHQNAEGAGKVFELHGAVSRQLPEYPVVVQALEGAGGYQVKTVGCLPQDGELGVHAAARRQRMTE